MEEIWKDIKGYENLYQVSNFGNVRPKARIVESKNGVVKEINGKILKKWEDKKGYLYVSLCKNGESKNYTVHRLVLTAFIENKDNLPCINHKDENKQNNKLENLEWCTYLYNSNYGSCRSKISQKARERWEYAKSK